MKRDLSLSIFLPAYNEEDTIASCVRAAGEAARRITDTYEIIVVDDGSADLTGAIADRLAAEDPHVRAVHHYSNMGYGAALWSGIQAARYEWVFFTDADLQFKLDELVRLADFVPDYRVVLGYRAPRRDSKMRLLNAWGWNRLNRMLFGLKVRDIDCAFKLFDRRLVAGLPIRSRGAMMSAEMLIRLSQKGIQMKEVPVVHVPRRLGVATGAKPAVIIRAFRELYRLYRGDLGEGAPGAVYIQMVTFALIGLVNTAVDISAYFALTRYVETFSGHLIAAKVLSFALGVASSFMLNRRFTFGLSSPVSVGEVARYYASVGAGVLVNAGALYVFHSIIGMHDLIAVGIATILTFFWGFLFSKFWVFSGPERAGKKKALAEGVAS